MSAHEPTPASAESSSILVPELPVAAAVGFLALSAATAAGNPSDPSAAVYVFAAAGLLAAALAAVIARW